MPQIVEPDRLNICLLQERQEPPVTHILMAERAAISVGEHQIITCGADFVLPQGIQDERPYRDITLPGRGFWLPNFSPGVGSLAHPDNPFFEFHIALSQAINFTGS